MSGIAEDSGILMIDGNEKPAGGVVAGDDVLVYDFENDRVMFGKVTGTRRNKGPAVEIVTASAKLVSSPRQRIFTAANVMKEAGDLRPGDEILWFDMSSPKPEKITVKRAVGDVALVELSVGDRSFVAGGLLCSA